MKIAARFGWIAVPVVCFAALAFLNRFGRHFIESRDTPGKAEDWLRFVIYSLILISLMLLRPQGLLGRSEIGLGWLTRGKRERVLASEAAGNMT